MRIKWPEVADDDVLARVEHYPRRKEWFAITITKSFVLILRKKRFSIGSPYYVEQVPNASMRAIHITPIGTAGSSLLAVLMIAAGGYATYAMVADIVNAGSGSRSVWPLVMLAAGVINLLAARDRYAVVVEWDAGAVTWKPPLTIGATGRDAIAREIQMIVDGARAAGIAVRDERSGLSRG